MEYFRGNNRIIFPNIMIIFICSTLLISIACTASVSRQITFEMLEENNVNLIKSRTYSGNETSMVRTQLDMQFGNSDGYLSEDEVDNFRASYDDYFEQTNYLIIEDILMVKKNASVDILNMVGSTDDNSQDITTTFTFEAHSPHLLLGSEHYIKFHRELWKYVDLDSNGQYTNDNNLTFIAPKHWSITYSRGLVNHSFSSDNRTLKANANLDFEWVTIKISKDVENNGGNGQNSEDDQLFLILVVVIIVIVMGAMVGIVMRKHKTAGSEDPYQPESLALSDEEIQQLNLEKEKIKREILKVRADLRSDIISKEDAKSKERTLKEKFKEIKKKLDSNPKNEDN